MGVSTLIRTPSSCAPLVIDLFKDGNSGASVKMSEPKGARYSETFVGFFTHRESSVLRRHSPGSARCRCGKRSADPPPRSSFAGKRMQTNYVRIMLGTIVQFSSVASGSVSPASLCWQFHPETRTARWSPETEPGPAGSGRTGSPTRSEQTTGRRLLDR